MISLVRASWQNNLRTPKFVGLSTDGYPDTKINGARIFYMDSGKEYEYSAEDETWYEVRASAKDHRELEHKDAINQHPIHSIIGLEDSLIDLQEQIDAITSQSDVVDVIGTYEDLDEYDTTSLSNNDIVKVLEDSTHEEAVSYYRWVKVGSVGDWEYVGSQSPYYTKSEVKEFFEAIDPQLLPTITEEEDNGKIPMVVAGEWSIEPLEHGQIIHATSSTTVMGYSVPRLTESQTSTIYNSYIAGKNVIISSVDGNHHYHVISVDGSDPENITSKVLYEDKLLLTYNKFGLISKYVPILNGDGQIVTLSREYGVAPNDHGFYREWSENPQGKVWVECGLNDYTAATMVGTLINLPATFEDTNYHVQVTPADLGNFHVCATPISKSAVNVRATDVNGSALAIKVYIEVKGWKEI